MPFSKKKKRGEHVSLSKLNSTDISSCVDSLCILISLFSLFVISYPILDKICGSKNWGGPIYRKLGRSPSRRRHSQISIYKNIHMSNLLIRLRLLFFSLFFHQHLMSCAQEGHSPLRSRQNLFASSNLKYYICHLLFANTFCHCSRPNF